MNVRDLRCLTDFSIDNYETDFDRDRIERPFVKETACECENRPPSGRCRPRGKGKISGLPLVERQNKQIKILYHKMFIFSYFREG